MLDAGPAQPDQVDAPRAVSVEDLARGEDTGRVLTTINDMVFDILAAARGLAALRQTGITPHQHCLTMLPPSAFLSGGYLQHIVL